MKNRDEKSENYKVLDIREASGNFLPGLLKTARKTEIGEGLCVVQTFKPLPLYSAMEELGFEHRTEKISEHEFRAYFFRVKKGNSTYVNTGDLPMKPTAMLNYKMVDSSLANISVDFWNLIWGKKDSAIDLKTKLILSLSNAVGAGRLRQASRELVKAYSIGLTVPEMDELFSLFAWNGGIGTFSSEIGPSSLFKAYKKIKESESKGKSREAITTELMENFGEDNPDTGVISKI